MKYSEEEINGIKIKVADILRSNRMAIYRDKYRSKYPDRVKESKHKWYINNKAKVKEYNNNYNSKRVVKYHLKKLDNYLLNSEFVLVDDKITIKTLTIGYIEYDNIKESVKSLIDIMESFKKFTL